MRTLLFLVFCSSGLAQAGESAYDRVVRTALERAQSELEDSVDIDVAEVDWANAYEQTVGRFTVRTVRSPAFARRLAQRQDAMFPRYQTLIEPGFEPGNMVVWVLPSIDDYNEFGNRYGAEHSSMHGSFLTNEIPGTNFEPIVTYHPGSETQLDMWITHGAVHQFLERRPRGDPDLWLSEGLASYFELNWNLDYGKQALQNYYRRGRTVPTFSLLRQGIGEYQAQPESLFQIGMLFSYLLNHREDTRTVIDENGKVVRQPFVDYLQGLLQGRDVSASPVNSLLGQNLVTLDNDFQRFVMGNG